MAFGEPPLDSHEAPHLPVVLFSLKAMASLEVDSLGDLGRFFWTVSIATDRRICCNGPCATDRNGG